MMKYKVIFLDWNGTLSKSKFWGHLQDIDEQHALLSNKIEDALFGQSREMFKPWMRGEYKSEDVCESIAKKADVDYETIFSEFVRGCELMELSSPEIPDLLQSIKETGSKIIIATDNMDSFTRWTYPILQKNILTSLMEY